MKSFFFKLFLLIAVSTLSTGTLFAQYDWEKYQSNPLNIHGSPGSWDESVVSPCTIFNAGLNRYETWYTAYDGSFPNGGIGFAWSTDGITWTKHPTPVMTPGATGWDSLFVGADCVRKEGSTYKMWYTGWKSSTRYPHSIGFATSPDGINWTKHPTPVLTPGTGWESGAVGYPSLIKVTSGYWMFYTGEVSLGVALTGRAFSTDGINWQKDLTNNPVLLAGGPGTWDRNNYLGRVIVLNNILYIYYTAEDNPGVSGSAIGFATSIDTGKTWTKDYSINPIITQGTPGSWDNGWIETGEIIFTQNELRLYYDGGSPSTGWLGRIGLAISNPLPAGTYTIGTGGNFATIQEAFTKLETDGVAGNVTLELIDDLYTAPTGQYGFSLNGPIPGAGPNSRVTIKPAENKNVIIEGSNECLLYLMNTSYVTFDGIDITGPTNLTIHALLNASYTYNDALDFMNNSDHNVMQNIIFIVEKTTSASGAGFWFTQTGSAPDSNLIQNNFVKKAGDALFIVSASASLKGKDNVIRGNQIGSETDSLISFGIEVSNCENSIIENNIIQNLKATIPGTNQTQIGILSSMSSSTIIRNNVLGNFKASNGYSASGIFLGSNGVNYGADNLVYNNMIYNIQSTSAQSDSRVTGIESWYQNNPKIYYNSIYLSGTGAQHLGSAALYIGGSNSNVEAMNNILVNTRDESPYYASAIYDYSASNLTSDYNDLYSNNYLVRIGSTNYTTLTDWQATLQDLNSISEMPNFISPYLHIDTTIVTMLNAHATPIAGIETDIDEQGRNAATPDIGADEFDIVSDVEGDETFPTEYSLEQNYPNPFNPSTTFRYSIPTQSKVTIKVYDILGNEIATLMDEEKSAGTYEIEFNSHSGEVRNLPSGVYFYQLKAGEFIDTKKMILLK